MSHEERLLQQCRGKIFSSNIAAEAFASEGLPRRQFSAVSSLGSNGVPAPCKCDVDSLHNFDQLVLRTGCPNKLGIALRTHTPVCTRQFVGFYKLGITRGRGCSTWQKTLNENEKNKTQRLRKTNQRVNRQ